MSKRGEDPLNGDVHPPKYMHNEAKSRSKETRKTKKQGSIHDLHAVATEHNKETMFDPAWHSKIEIVCVVIIIFLCEKKQ